MKLSLLYPVKPFIVTQGFGEDLACYRASDKLVVGKNNGVCPDGFVSLYAASNMKGHNGIDMIAPHGVPVYASHDGWVEEVQSESARGLGLGIVTNEKFEYDNYECKFKTRYWHLLNFNVGYDDVVKAGDLIGWADNTGYSSASHLHFELKPVTTDSRGRYINILQDNGFHGGVDATPFFRYIFTKNMKFGDKNDDVGKLQEYLKEKGYFNKTQEITKYYGSITRKAVADFQLANGISLKDSLFGFWCGPATRRALNA